MQHGHGRVEAVAEPADELRGEADLGDQNQRASALLEHSLDEAQVDLRLAAAGDSVEHECAKSLKRLAHSLDCQRLLLA